MDKELDKILKDLNICLKKYNLRAYIQDNYMGIPLAKSMSTNGTIAWGIRVEEI